MPARPQGAAALAKGQNGAGGMLPPAPGDIRYGSGMKYEATIPTERTITTM